MNRDDIIRMAREVWGDDSGKPWHESAVTHLEAFAKLVAAAEREACAKVCEQLGEEYAYANEEHCAEAIRARGQE
jgi:hypothetical protein